MALPCWLTEEIIFPAVDQADEDGILAFGGDLQRNRLLLAYHSGIFPWYADDQPIIWWAPDPRFVLFPNELHISHSMARIMRSGPFSATADRAFSDVIRRCRRIHRPGQDESWITPEMEAAYVDLHETGHAHSIEVWQDDELVGGLYGVVVGGCFCGESMFATVPNASKFALIKLVEHVSSRGFVLIDSQVPNAHMTSLGARDIPRQTYMHLLTQCLEADAVW